MSEQGSVHTVRTSDGQLFEPGYGPKAALLTAHTRHEIDGFIARFPLGRQRSATLSALRFVQEQNDGFLTPELMDAVDPGGLGGTYAGSPVACAAALAVLEVIDQERLVERAGVLGERVAATLEKWTARSDLRPLGHVRALGSMIAFDLLEARGADEVDALAAQAVLKRAHALGLILLGCGAYGEAIRILFPLTIGDAELDEGMALLEQALAID